MGGDFDVALLVGLIDAADGDVFARGHLEAHEVLKDDADVAVEIFEGVLAQVDAVEQDLSFGGIVESGDEFDDGGLALAVLADQRDSFAGRESEVEVLQHRPVGARIGEGDIAKFEAAVGSDWAWADRWVWIGRLASCRRMRCRSVRKSA